jgi:glycosyltransferase involved in cell wall biosynthesis
MKLLYIGHYKENSGWSNTAINYILALDSIGVDVVCRNIKLTDTYAEVPHRIRELEQKSLTNIDYCIQNVLPHHLVGTKKFKKNIAYFLNEAYPLKNISWYNNLLQMDEIWVPNQTNKLDIESANKDIKVRVLHHTFDLSKYSEKYNQINFKFYNNKFKFYTIADINDRKNLQSIIRAFHSEFTNDEPVVLVMKLKKYGYTTEQLEQYIKKEIDQIKQSMRIYQNIDSYNSEIIICNEMDDYQINSLHTSCDCFIGASHGEGWSIPAFDAMCFGKTPICSNEGGPAEFIPSNDKNCGFLIDGVYNVCNHADPAFPELFSGLQEWFIPSEQKIKQAMRYYYENKDSINRSSGLNEAQKYSYQNIANQIKEYLND